MFRLHVSTSAPAKVNDFSVGSIPKTILKLAVPMTLAQLVNVLYNIVDRMYIGRLADIGRVALTGVGVAFPLITIINAFAFLCGMGGSPLCSIARGRGDTDEAEKIMGNSLTLLLICAVVLTAGIRIFRRPMLAAFGASSTTMPYAVEYMDLYITGTLFVMLGAGMNSFISAQGFGTMSMVTTLLGAAVNIVLDPILMFTLGLGVRGAALATIISQFCSALWVMLFLVSRRALLRLRLRNLRLSLKRLGSILALGLSSFVMSVTNSLVQIICNSTLLRYGGDLYVSVMVVITSLHEVVNMVIQGITRAAHPVLGYNYGAGTYTRIKESLNFITWLCVGYALAATVLIMLIPGTLVKIFNDDQALVRAAIPAIRIYFLCYFMMAFQMSGQTAFLGLGMSRHAIFFSLLRKAIIVVPLSLLLPRIGGMGVFGVFWAEPISCIIGGLACYLTMRITLWPKLAADKPTGTCQTPEANTPDTHR